MSEYTDSRGRRWECWTLREVPTSEPGTLKVKGPEGYSKLFNTIPDAFTELGELKNVVIENYVQDKAIDYLSHLGTARLIFRKGYDWRVVRGQG